MQFRLEEISRLFLKRGDSCGLEAVDSITPHCKRRAAWKASCFCAERVHVRVMRESFDAWLEYLYCSKSMRAGDSAFRVSRKAPRVEGALQAFLDNLICCTASIVKHKIL